MEQFNNEPQKENLSESTQENINKAETENFDENASNIFAGNNDLDDINGDNGVNFFGDDTVYFEDESDNEFTPPVMNNTAVFDEINFTQVTKTEKTVSNRGLRVFALIMAFVIAISGACLAGYYIGQDNKEDSFIGNKVTVNLASKPKDTDEFTPAQVYEKLNESIVGIRVYNTLGSTPADASGVIYSKDGYIVTNDHIYSEIPAPKFKIYTHDGTEYDAVYVAGDTVSDLAVLKVKDADFKPATFGDSRELVFGENVVAIGRPSDATAASSISKGIVSAVSRRVTTTSSYSARLIQTDSAINPGSSGGALVNMYGQVIGITASKLAGVEYDAIGFAIPTVTMKRVVEQLIENGRVIDRAKLGISYSEVKSVTAEIQDIATTGLYIESVDEESDLYGKVTKGAIITRIQGKKITNDDMVLDVIEECRAGDKIVIVVILTNGSSKEFTVKLRANVGQSSYSETIKESGNNNSSGGEFNFPFGE